MPKNGQITLDQWKGYGLASYTDYSVAMLIAGGYFGGYSSTINSVVSSAQISQWYNTSPSYTAGSTGQKLAYTPYTTPARYAADPVDMLSGAFCLDKTDLTLGGSAMPRGLSFSRQYNSNRRYDKTSGLGYGWTHNYEISVAKRSSTSSSLAETISYQAVPFFAAIQVATDLYKNQSNAKEWMTSMLAVHWAIDQMKYNAVAVSLGNRTIEFIKMPNGSYEPPAGMNYTLNKYGSGATEYFTMVERNGSTYTFNTSGKIATIKDLWNKTQSFNYTTGLLTSVVDAYGRTLTLTRSGDKITAIADANNRSVSFAYTGDNLTGCTDPEGKVWTYLYDTDHKMIETRDPSNRTIVKNNYDSLNRVNEQLNSGDTNRRYFLTYTGYCNVEEAPNGSRTCYLYDSRGRSVGMVDPLGNSSATTYDGQDHLIKSFSEKGELTDHYFDKNNNYLGVNDPIAAETFLSYDSLQRVISTTDKRGFISTVDSYNSNHQPLSVTAPLLRTISSTYTTNGEVATSTDAENNVTVFTYNSLGQLTNTRVNG